MREDDMLRLSLRCAALAVEGVAYERVLADGVAAILQTDAGTGVSTWAATDGTAGFSVDVVTSGARPFTDAQVAAVTSAYKRHPTAGRWLSIPTRRVSDTVSLPEFWDTEVWRIMHGHVDGRYPAAAMLSCTRNVRVFIGVHRARRDFDADDMAVLDLVREPLAAALAFRAAWDSAIGRCRIPVAESPRSLTHREEQVIGLVALGWTSSRIGRHLRISERTVRKHLENVNDKLGTVNRAAAVHRWQAGDPRP